FFQFVNQVAPEYLIGLISMPGRRYNIPTVLADRWQNPGDNTDIQRFSNSGAPQTAFRTYELSDKAYVDASYIRMKNVSLVYLLPEHWLGRLALNECRISLHCQNLLTITGYQGSDPEVPNPRQLPPLRMITGKIQLTF